jgi:hypothetical protein
MMKVKTKSGETITLEFLDSFFESFSGTDEELQKIMQDIIDMVGDGTLMDESVPVEEEDLDSSLEEIDNLITKRTVQ